LAVPGVAIVVSFVIGESRVSRIRSVSGCGNSQAGAEFWAGSHV